MADRRTRARLVEPLGTRGTRVRKTIDGEEVRYRPTVDSLIRERKRKTARKGRVVIRLKR